MSRLLLRRAGGPPGLSAPPVRLGHSPPPSQLTLGSRICAAAGSLELLAAGSVQRAVAPPLPPPSQPQALPSSHEVSGSLGVRAGSRMGSQGSSHSSQSLPPTPPSTQITLPPAITEQQPGVSSVAPSLAMMPAVTPSGAEVLFSPITALSQPLVPPPPPAPERSRARRGRSSSSSSSRESRRRHGSHRHRSRRRSGDSAWSRRSRSSRWRSPSSSEGSVAASGESVRRVRVQRNRRTSGRSSRAQSLVLAPSLQPEVPVPGPAVAPIPPPSGIPILSPGSGTGGPGMPPAPVGFGGQQLMSLVRSSVSPATWQTHGNSWVQWWGIVGERDVGARDDLRLEVTVEWLLYLRSLRVSAAVAQRRLSGIAFHFKLRGWSDVTKHFVIRQALKGWRKEYVSRESRRPVSFGLLGKLISLLPQVCSSPFEVSLFSGSFSLAFFAALRVVEIGVQAVGPVVLVVHAGGNDIGSVPLLELLTLMRSDLERFPSFFREGGCVRA
ncbi:uncharacterized protein LOC122939275 [Bufo gargarizans]|uniref:uncharacterized protein LOC122939275 n=1 Tax=Bufo gargarizans TaxID=30331 RepID=UPI001CF5FD5D|nr:uncharacterized protein LOC122939275 [Bufo gargarizans]